MPVLTDDTGCALVVYHGTRETFSRLDLSKTVDGGLHFGSQEQARMRAGKHGRLIAAHVEITSAQRSRDLGGGWKRRIQQAKAAGHDAIVYLNRYEGLSIERVMQAQREGVELDTLTDAQFRRYVPEAQDSWIVFSLDQVKLLPEPTPTSPRPRR